MSVESILQSLAENAGNAVRSRGQVIGNTIAGASFLPAQIMAGRDQATLEAQQQATAAENIQLKRAEAIRAEAQAKRQGVMDQAQLEKINREEKDRLDWGKIVDKAYRPDGTLDYAVGAQMASDIGRPDMKQDLAKHAADNAPKVGEAAPGTQGRYLSGPQAGQLIPGTQVPPKAEPVTSAQLDKQAQDILAKPDVQRTADETAQLNAYQQRKIGDQHIVVKTMKNGKPVESIQRRQPDGSYKEVMAFPSQPPASMTINPALVPSGDALEMAAKQYLATGALPSMGMGQAGAAARVAVMNRAAQIDPQAGLAANKASFAADSANLKKLQTTEGTLSAFEKTAGKNLDQFLALADKVPDTGVPWLNTPIRAVNASALGSADQAAFNAARDVALREIARVTNDPKLSGALTDSARKEVASLSSPNATFAQIKAVAKVLKQDMANVHSGINEQIQTVKSGLQGHPGVTAPAQDNNASDGSVQVGGFTVKVKK